MVKAITTALSDMVSLVFPDLCSACGNHLYKGEKVICTMCRVALPYTDDVAVKDNKVEQLFWGRCNVAAAASLLRFRKAGKVQNLLHELKYRGNKDVGRLLGRMLGSNLQDSPRFERIDLVVPVPLHHRKLRSRTYNQAGIFAEGIAEALTAGLSEHNLFRAEFTETQTRKHRYERFQNVERVFDVRVPRDFHNKRILLVDDVITTGSTLEACVNTIHRSCAATIFIGSIANAL